MPRIPWLIVILLALAGPARADPPELLDDAIRRWIADEDHWAYTRHQSMSDQSKPMTDVVERYDPSQPDERQWQLLEIAGKPPTPDEIKAWQRRKEREVKRIREKPIADYFDFDHATVADETAGSVRYEVPLRKEAYRRVPLDKFLVSVTVNKSRRDLERLTMGLKENFRFAMGTTKVTNFGLDIRFQSIDPTFASQPVTIKGSGSLRVLFFMKMGREGEVAWTDFKRVKPYKERYGVKIGDLKALDF